MVAAAVAKRILLLLTMENADDGNFRRRCEDEIESRSKSHLATGLPQRTGSSSVSSSFSSCSPACHWATGPTDEIEFAFALRCCLFCCPPPPCPFPPPPPTAKLQQPLEPLELLPGVLTTGETRSRSICCSWASISGRRAVLRDQ